MSGLRRAIALLLLLLPLHAAGAAVLAPATDAHGICTDHLCRCAGTRPARPAAEAPCHEAQEAPDLLFEHAGCHHGQPPAAPDSVRPHVLPLPIAVVSTLAIAGAVLAVDGAPALGFLEIDLPPPRARA